MRAHLRFVLFVAGVLACAALIASSAPVAAVVVGV
jgi:hypothetical protein